MNYCFEHFKNVSTKILKDRDQESALPIKHISNSKHSQQNMKRNHVLHNIENESTYLQRKGSLLAYVIAHSKGPLNL
jgi:hypothetical protein